MSYMLRNGKVGLEVVTANATLLREKRNMGDGKEATHLPSPCPPSTFDRSLPVIIGINPQPKADGGLGSDSD
ncbi:hypothetical protein [Pseudomonas fluorescens]|uniref:hypothetical protein n=1 Tax=Pseudomonas fluorescens TaxID=294 RepID=UPI00163A68AE|nr:hypothetical protein [Pseudomonas fluorescens]